MTMTDSSSGPTDELAKDALVQTLALDGVFNARTDDEALWPAHLRPTLATLPRGAVAFWGLPFEFAQTESTGPNIVVVGGQSGVDAVEIPVDEPATFMVVAHFCDQGPEEDGVRYLAHNPGLAIFGSCDPGSVVGRYALVYGDGSETEAPARRRYEIVPPWQTSNQLPFVAMRNPEPGPLDFRGPSPRGGWGAMQTSVGFGRPNSTPTRAEFAKRLANPAGMWTYWAFENPAPGEPIRALRLRSESGATVALGAVTLYRGRSHPFRRERLETVHVRPSGPGAVPGDPDVAVDLGMVARSFPADPLTSLDVASLPAPGIGAPDVEPSPADGTLVQLAASRDATLRIGESAVPMRALYETGDGISTDGRWQARIVERERVWLDAQVIDAATGQPMPARVGFRSAEGRYLPPYGHRAEVNTAWFEDYGSDLKLGSTSYAYVDGRFRIELPVGQVLAEISKGFEYAPVRTMLTIEPGQTELTLPLERQANTRDSGWVSADTHVHFLSPDTARLEASAEGVNVVNLLAAQWGDLYTNVGDITGDLAACSDEETLVWVGSENRQPFLGHVSLLGIGGTPVMPFSTSGPSESYLGDGTATSIADWADEARRKNGLVVSPHFPFPHAEVIADIILGKVDAIEFGYWMFESLDDFRVKEWYRLLDCGYRVPVVGGTDKMSADVPLGGTRTYALVGDEPLDFGRWSAAVRAGRTYMTTGPLLSLEVEGLAPGDDLELPAGGGTVHVRAEAVSAVPVRTLEIVHNGRVVARADGDGTGQGPLILDQSLRLDAGGWIAARCNTSKVAWYNLVPTLMAAHTSPVYVRVGNTQQPVTADMARPFLVTMQGSLEWLRTLAPVESPAAHERVQGVFVRAIEALQSKVG